MKIKCELCGKEYSRLNYLQTHVRKYHDCSVQEYYDTYLRKENEGICPTCKKQTTFTGFTHGYKQHCNNSCAQLDPEVQNKLKQTMLERYGVDNCSKLEAIKKKKCETMMKHYGCEYNIHRSGFREASLKKVAKKYNMDSITNISQVPQIKEKIKNTCLEKYGVDNVRKSPEIQEKIFKTKKSKSIQFAKDNNCTSVPDLIKEYGTSWFSIRDNFRVERLNHLVFIGNEHLEEIKNYQASNQSSFEKEVDDFVSLYTQTQHSRDIIKPLELDIYCEDKYVAIECNGVYWHSINNGVDKNYHLYKTKKCEEKGIRLIHIFENEWYDKKDICKSIIISALGYSNKIYARNCEVKEVSREEEKIFLQNNHLQGYIPSKLCIGLYYNNELVQLLSFGKSRFSGTIELLRSCSKLNTNVIGGFQKLLKYQPYDDFISYVDRSKFDGSGYKDNFEFLEYTAPSYFYYKNGETISRYKAQKHKLHKLLDNFDSNKTEMNNMLDNGYLMIYNCGNMKYQYHRE